MKFLADENFNNQIVRGILRRNPTVDIERIQDVGLSGVDDPAVLAWAAEVDIQKRIHKKAEYRVTLIGKKHFVCRIEAEAIQDQDVQLDWRVTEPDKLAHCPDALPDDYIQKLYGMLKVFGLNFGAFDIIRDDDDQLYFIELNPNGQWYWIELLTGLPMVQAMVELLEQLADRYISL
jgi:glutathione synthase/RimK-type ligase-like ATP-grasp enzyme